MEDRYFVIEVIGSEDYTVEIELEGNGTVIRSSCNCPYDWGDYCKHETAALFALREKYESEHDVTYKGKSSFQKKLKLEEILPNLSRDELIQIILSMTSEHEQIKKKLLFQLAPKKDEIAVSKKLIRDYINRAKHRGFIKWNKVSNALYGVDLTLTKASEKIGNKEEEMAVFLGLTVLPIVVDMLEYSDDSSGSIGFRINEDTKVKLLHGTSIFLKLMKVSVT